MYDQRTVGTHFNEPTLLAGRFLGANTSAPTVVTAVKDSAPTSTSMTRNGVGNLTVVFLDKPLGIPQCYDFWAACPANNKNVQITPPTTAAPGTYNLLVTFAANGVAVDLQNTEELVFECWYARTQVP